MNYNQKEAFSRLDINQTLKDLSPTAQTLEESCFYDEDKILMFCNLLNCSRYDIAITEDEIFFLSYSSALPKNIRAYFKALFTQVDNEFCNYAY